VVAPKDFGLAVEYNVVHAVGNIVTHAMESSVDHVVVPFAVNGAETWAALVVVVQGFFQKPSVAWSHGHPEQ
jgi:hypothetical protein